MESTTFVDPDSPFEHFKVLGTYIGPRKGPNRRTHNRGSKAIANHNRNTYSRQAYATPHIMLVRG